MKDLAATINAADVDAVVIATPIDLRRIMKIKKPSVRVRYELQEIGSPNLTEILEATWKRVGKGKRKTA
jgi:predicted GTPase